MQADCAIVQAVADFPNAEAWLRYLAYQNGICGRKKVLETGFLPGTLALPCKYQSTDASYPY